MAAPLLELRGLSISRGKTLLTEDVALSVNAGEMVGLIGESGSGKSITALAILRLLASPPLRVSRGEILFEGIDLLKLSPREMTARRGREIAMIFQEPMTSLNPVLTVGDQLTEGLILRDGVNALAARERAGAMVVRVGLPAPARILSSFPHQLSGGQRQRVMIAMALIGAPKLLIADEPTTALDVTVQAQILTLIAGLRAELNLGCLLITHDLGVVAQTCARAYVMYGGRIVETGPVGDLLQAPRHRYTRALIDSLPQHNPVGVRLPAIPGQVPKAGEEQPGCAFAPRCQARVAACSQHRPHTTQDGPRAFACWNPVA